MAVKIKDLIARKTAGEAKERKTATVFVPSLNDEVVVIEPTEDQIARYEQAMTYQYGPNKDGDTLQTTFERLVYDCVKEPNLKDPELQKALNVPKMEPVQVVREVFGVAEVPQIGKIILDLAGKNSSGAVRLVDELKN